VQLRRARLRLRGAPQAGDAPKPIALDGWRRAEHQGLTVYTNAADATAQSAFRQLRRFMDAVSQVVFKRPFEMTRPIEVFVFRSQEEYARFAPEWVAGHARREADESQIALSIEHAFAGTGTLYHELVHAVLLNHPSRRFPSWFHEGLAVFLATSVLRGDVLTMGALSPEAMAWIRTADPLPLRRLLATPVAAQRNVGLFYADAWAFVHFGLLSASLGGPDRRREFGDFVARVSRAEPWGPAFQAAFRATPEAIAEEHEAHREKLTRIGVVTLLNLRLASDDPPPALLPVVRLEIARQLAALADGAFEDHRFETEAQLYDELLAADPNDPDAICGRIRVAAAQDELELAEELWHRLAEDQRRDASAALAEGDLALARAKELPPDEPPSPRATELTRAISAYQRALAEAPDLAAIEGLGEATVLAEHEDPAPAIAALGRALELDPESPKVRLDLAELLIRSNAPGDAAPHIDYVIEAYPRSDYSHRASVLQAALAEAAWRLFDLPQNRPLSEQPYDAITADTHAGGSIGPTGNTWIPTSARFDAWRDTRTPPRHVGARSG
jgi:tetratricopeptide (TPR) repeat protein